MNFWRTIRWGDSNGYWGISTYDHLHRLVRYEDYTGFWKNETYTNDGIEIVTSTGQVYTIKYKKAPWPVLQNT